jgi:NAD(P)-dependent dehydrogenase (short-subunit alcohol dehydrogenase family)
MRPLGAQTILVTGSSDGHGKRVAQELADRGATVLVHGRDREKTDAAAREIGSEHVRIADLASLDDVRHLAAEIDDLDTLVNNAGIISLERRESANGYELTFAVNYLSHFLLTQLLLRKLQEPGRIVNVSSIGQERVDFEDLMFERDYNSYSAYARSKLAQVLFTFELAERLGDRDITVNALHPATLMDTKMVSGGGVSPQSSVEEGAEATLRLVADPELDGVSGRFFDGRRESGTHR